MISPKEKDWAPVMVVKSCCRVESFVEARGCRDFLYIAVVADLPKIGQVISSFCEVIIEEATRCSSDGVWASGGTAHVRRSGVPGYPYHHEILAMRTS